MNATDHRELLQALASAADRNKSEFVQRMGRLDRDWRSVERLLKAALVIVVRRLADSTDVFDDDFVRGVAEKTVSRWPEPINLNPDLVAVIIHVSAPGYDGAFNSELSELPVNILGYHAIAFLGYATGSWTEDQRLQLFASAESVLTA